MNKKPNLKTINFKFFQRLDHIELKAKIKFKFISKIQIHIHPLLMFGFI